MPAYREHHDPERDDEEAAERLRLGRDPGGGPQPVGRRGAEDQRYGQQQRAGTGDPTRVYVQRLGRDESTERRREYAEGVPGRRHLDGRSRPCRGGQVGAEEPPEDQVLDDDHRRPGLDIGQHWLDG
ncbi:hypothetical protein ACN27G_00315 [Plantactinospora sp. WMMB334]|uniref:hypothetical protein n=1 Tax=Plantactinospora sp. WMMB334 TaxID=3404119 RepID=UPI003B922DF7